MISEFSLLSTHKFGAPKSEICCNRKYADLQIRRSSSEHLKIYASALITGSPQPKNAKTRDQKTQKICSVFPM